MQKRTSLFKKSIYSLGILTFLLVIFIMTGCCSKTGTEQQQTQQSQNISSQAEAINKVQNDPLGLGNNIVKNPQEPDSDKSVADNPFRKQYIDEQKAVEQPKEKKKKKTIGFMISPKGLDDKGFNEIAHRGLEEAEKIYDFETTLIEPSTLQDKEATLRFFASQKFDAIIALGDHSAEVKKIAVEHPETEFYVIDSDIVDGNMKGIAFRDGEGAFLCGYLAAKLTKSQKVGFIGGTPCKVMDRFETGYRNGVKYANSEAEVVVEYIAKTPYDFSGFSNDNDGNKIGDKMYKEGVDVIFPACGSSALGVIDAAETNQKFVFGVDDNQDFLLPKYVVTSMIKRVDKVIIYIAENVCNSNAKNLKTSYGIAEDALGLTAFEYSKGKTVSVELISEIEGIKEKIKNGKINCMETIK